MGKQIKMPQTNDKTDGGNHLLAVAVCLTAVAVVSTFVFSAMVFMYMRDSMASQREHASLLALAEINHPVSSAFYAEMRQINPDYVCWLTIDGTPVSYPVVRGSDNETYLTLSFFGEENMLGTLFMDYRNVEEYVPHIIIYGHNAKQGQKFGSLHRFIDESFAAEHPIITLKVNDRIVEYEIFSARKTDVTDDAYHLDFSAPGSFQAFAERNGAPPDAVQIITLSTCVSGGDDDARIIVQGALRQTIAH